MYEARQNKEKISRRIDGEGMTKQRVKMNDNRVRTIQYHMGNRPQNPSFVCSCTSDVYYHFGKKYGHSKGSGGNDRNTKSDVLDLFIAHGLMELKNIPQQDNPPGQCAEPHSVADALKNVPKKATILEIKVSDAKKVDGTVKPRCKTCKQWINNNSVEKRLLKQRW